MKKIKMSFIWAVLCMALVSVLAACSTSISADPVSSGQEGAEDLSGKTLFVYCGAGMKDPMTEIVNAFKEETGCETEITFGNAAQITSQITVSEEGDVFIAGAEGELKALKEAGLVADSKQLAEHIPVIAVQSGDPSGIKEIADLGKGVRLVLGDAESTPIGKVANAVLEDQGILDSADILARTSTAPEMLTALSSGQADAAIVWKENAEGKDGIEIIDVPGMEKYIKIIPAASLSCSANTDALAAFLEYLDTDRAHDIWTSYGYVTV